MQKKSRVKRYMRIQDINTLANLPENAKVLIKTFEQATGVSYANAKAYLEEDKKKRKESLIKAQKETQFQVLEQLNVEDEL